MGDKSAHHCCGEYHKTLRVLVIANVLAAQAATLLSQIMF